MDFVTFFIFLTELIALTWALYRSGFMPFPHGFMIYLFISQLFLWLHIEGVIYYWFLETFSTGAYEDHYIKVMFLYYAFFLAATLCTPSIRIDIRKALTTSYFFDKGTEHIYYSVLISILYLRFVLHIIYIDWSIVWEADEYLQMATALTREDSLGLLLAQSARLFGLLSVILAAFFAGRRKWALFFAMLPLVAWHVLFDLASHSRTIVAYFFMAGLVALVLRPGRLGAPIVLLGAAIVGLFGSLAGRGSGHHGFSSLPFYLSNIFERPVDYGDLTNISEGIFVTSEIFANRFVYDPTFKVLSLSPLLSFMDGYDSIREQYEIKLSYYVPNSAVNEVISFGLIYAVIFFGVQFLAGWLSAQALARRQTALSLFINSAVLLAAYLQFAYSTRTVFRFFLIGACVSAYLLYVQSRSQAKVQQPSEPAGSRRAVSGATGATEGPRARRRARAAEAETQARRIRRAATLVIDAEPGRAP